MNYKLKNMSHLSVIHKIILLFVMVITSIGAQDFSRDKTPLSFVFLPLRASQLYQMEVEQFMDEFIKVLRLRGHNAVSTRYLKSVLLDSRLGELDACTTEVCMSQLVRLVGTRFLIHGSLQTDSSMMFVVNVKVIDVPNNTVLIVQQDNFSKNAGISAAKTSEFIDKLLNRVNTALVGAGDAPVVPVPDLAATGSDVTQHVEVPVPVSDTAEKSSDSSGRAPGTAEITQNLTVDSLVDQPTENVSDTSDTSDISDIYTPVDTAATDFSNALVISNNETDSGKVFDTAKVELSVSAPPQASLKMPLQDYQSNGPAAPPEALKRENVRKKLKIVRISTFGGITLAAFSGGIAINNLVKKSIGKERTFFNDYMQADEHRADTAYQAYILQTEKTDARMRQRSFLYTLSVLGLVGGVISFKF